MAYEQIATRPKVIMELFEKLYLCFSVEVDDDITAEYDIHGYAYSKIAVHKIEALKSDTTPQFRDDAEKAVPRVLPLHAVFAFQQGWDRFHDLFWIDPPFADSQYSRGYVSG